MNAAVVVLGQGSPRRVLKTHASHTADGTRRRLRGWLESTSHAEKCICPMDTDLTDVSPKGPLWRQKPTGAVRCSDCERLFLAVRLQYSRSTD
jgi:hypothetical protein